MNIMKLHASKIPVSILHIWNDEHIENQDQLHQSSHFDWKKIIINTLVNKKIFKNTTL